MTIWWVCNRSSFGGLRTGPSTAPLAVKLREATLRMTISIGNGKAVAREGGEVISGWRDESQLQPLRVYVPLLAHNSGLGGLASSERSASPIWNFQLIRNPSEPRPDLSRLLYCASRFSGDGLQASRFGLRHFDLRFTSLIEGDDDERNRRSDHASTGACERGGWAVRRLWRTICAGDADGRAGGAGAGVRDGRGRCGVPRGARWAAAPLLRAARRRCILRSG